MTYDDYYVRHNQKIYNNNEYTENVRMFLKAYDIINYKKGTHIEEQLTCKENKELNKYSTLYLKIMDVLDKYCKHIVTKPQFNKEEVGFPLFIQLYSEYTKPNMTNGILRINEELTPILDENPYITVDLIYKKDNSFPEELIRPVNVQYLHKMINEHYNQDIYKLDDKYFDEDGRIKNLEEYYEY